MTEILAPIPVLSQVTVAFYIMAISAEAIVLRYL